MKDWEIFKAFASKYSLTLLSRYHLSIPPSLSQVCLTYKATTPRNRSLISYPFSISAPLYNSLSNLLSLPPQDSLLLCFPFLKLFQFSLYYNVAVAVTVAVADSWFESSFTNSSIRLVRSSHPLTLLLLLFQIRCCCGSADPIIELDLLSTYRNLRADDSDSV